MGIPGSPNTSLPDKGMNWVPFTYAGDVYAYALTSESGGNTEASQWAAAATESDDFGYADMRSLFIAENALTTTANWNALNDSNLIFGTSVKSGGIDYTLRAPSMGSEAIKNSSNVETGEGTPGINEWDAIGKKLGWNTESGTTSFAGQDTTSYSVNDCVGRSKSGVFSYQSKTATQPKHYLPVLEPARKCQPEGGHGQAEWWLPCF